MSPPIASSSATSSGRRTMLTVFKPRVFAKAITHRPTPELAACCTTHSPGFRVTYSLSSSAAVGGLMASIANCCGSAPGGRAKRPFAEMTIRTGKRRQDAVADLDVLHPLPHGENAAACLIADDGWKRGAECIGSLCEHEVARVYGGKLDADEDLGAARRVGLGNVDILKTFDRV